MMTSRQYEKQYNLDRKAASKLLKVSIRTLDRYIKNKKLSTEVVGGHIWLKKEEVASFKSRQVSTPSIDNSTLSTSYMSIDNRVDNVDNEVDKVDNIEIIDQENLEENYLTQSIKKRKRPVGESENQIYKKLYEEIKQEVLEKQERLEMANYRVGQLEAQVRNSIPLLQYNMKKFEIEKVEVELKTKLEEKENDINNISKKLKIEKFNKTIFVITLLTILALQPLWLLLLYK